jgi:hypothetical protein
MAVYKLVKIFTYGKSVPFQPEEQRSRSFASPDVPDGISFCVGSAQDGASPGIGLSAKSRAAPIVAHFKIFSTVSATTL